MLFLEIVQLNVCKCKFVINETCMLIGPANTNSLSQEQLAHHISNASIIYSRCSTSTAVFLINFSLCVPRCNYL